MKKQNNRFSAVLFLAFLAGTIYTDKKQQQALCDLANFLAGGNEYKDITTKNYHFAQPILFQLFANNLEDYKLFKYRELYSPLEKLEDVAILWSYYGIAYYNKDATAEQIALALKKDGVESVTLCSEFEHPLYQNYFKEAFRLSLEHKEQYLAFHVTVAESLHNSIMINMKRCGIWEDLYKKKTNIFFIFNDFKLAVNKDSDIKYILDSWKRRSDFAKTIIGPNPIPLKISKKVKQKH